MVKTYDYLFKLLSIGDMGVGKTSIVSRFCGEDFKNDLQSTIGLDFKTVRKEVNGKKINLQIWDTAGQERFRTIPISLYRGVMGIVLVYDVTKEESFNSIRSWVVDIEKIDSDFIKVILLGNKCDLEDIRQVSKKRGEQLALEYGFKFFETSAKSFTNIDDVFLTLVRDVKVEYENRLEANGTGDDRSVVRIQQQNRTPPNQNVTCNCNIENLNFFK